MRLYHISEKGLSDRTLIPRIPDNFMTKNGYEDSKTPRVSFSKSIDGCLMGLGGNIQNKTFEVYEAIGDYDIKEITNKEVPDQSLTDEVWIISKVKVKKIGKIKTNNAIDTPYEFIYGNNIKADLYKWNWDWIYKTNVNTIEESNNSEYVINNITGNKTKEGININESANNKEYTINDIINIQEKNITKSLFIELFGNFDGKPKYDPSDIITIPPGKYGTTKKNKNEFTTTIGIWLFNKYCIEPTLFDVLGYINENVHGKKLDSINKSLSYAILEGVITINDIKPYLMKQQHLMRLVSVLAPNHSMKMLKTSTYIDKKRKELIAKNKEELEAGNEIVSSEIEKELVDYALDYLGDDDSLDMYNSKARGSIGNNFKNMFIMRGAIMNPDPNKGFDIATSNLIDGISKDEYAIMANSLVAGAYAKAKNTATGGHMAKLYINAFQHVVLDKRGSDCKTKRYIDVTLDSSVIDNYMYSYIISGQSLIELNSKNKDKYLNKRVKLRYSSMCESKTGICNMCAGNLFYLLDKTNIGMVTVIIANKVMLLSMKKFHDQTVKLHDMDVNKAFGL